MEILKILGELKHNLFTGIIKAVLNLVLVSSMTFSVMNVTHPTLEVAFFENYEQWMLFFLDGSFAVPFGVFVLLWFITDYAARATFGIVTSIIEAKWRERILLMTLDDNSIKVDIERDGIKDLMNALKETPQKHWAIKVYEMVWQSFPEKKWEQIKQRIRRVKQDYFNDFVVLFRSFIMLIVYFIWVSSFGWIMFVLLFVLFCIIGLLLVIYYLFASALPLVESVMRKEVERRSFLHQANN
jgi:hypothetical protein